MNRETMKISNPGKLAGLLIAVLFFASCQKKADPVTAELSASPSEIKLAAGAGTADLTISGNAQWSIDNAAPWLQLDKASGSSGNSTVRLTASANGTGATRSIILTVNASNGQSRRVTVSQTAEIYPSYNTSPKAADSTGMSTAVQLAAKFKLGWNIGNTMEATGGESAWGNPRITESYIKYVKQLGFSSIRIPCAWDSHVDNKATAHIDQNWLNRVKEVVGYCVNNDMYVMLNIHWDGGWLEQNFTAQKKDSVNAKQKAFWEQIATTMRDFDEHLMFASANEPAADNADKMSILTLYHQTFINAVRSTGGRNSHRVLILQGPTTSMSLTYDLMNVLPSDPVANRLMIEIHNYTPAQFCFLNEDASWGKMFYYWGNGHHSTIEPDRNATWGEEDNHLADFKKMKEKFIDKGIPVLMGEYGAYRRNNTAHVPKDLATHEASVDYWITFVTKQALAYGIKPFWWDTGGALDRQSNIVKDQRTIDAILAGGK
ncbi:cellulase family glycosylhydrolase [Chitinophaga filiformis]|uniref:Cellulase family glycosylhydrolase n=1 Tax=Chitinophaga filiformis TaxID=104663 RepID=A0ABY4HW41_CHIFI|nr:cellulase family glycosylhydrolase [Chitinophaga filiformis]UPK67389.1 cellulase family glycosylhydrolase [Chitinophaga filiformis]